jgi:hypothetical protein
MHPAEIVIRLVFGTAALLAAALSASAVSHAVNVPFLERQHLTDRHRNARKRRKTSCFSKRGEAHEAMTYFFPFIAPTVAGRCGRSAPGPRINPGSSALRRWRRV